MPSGKCVLGVEFTKQSQTPQATTGSLALFIDDTQVGALQDVKIQHGKFALAGEGLDIGRDGASPVTWDYPGERPWAPRVTQRNPMWPVVVSTVSPWRAAGR